MKIKKKYSLKTLILFLKDFKNRKFLLKNKKILKNFGLKINLDQIQNMKLNNNYLQKLN